MRVRELRVMNQNDGYYIEQEGIISMYYSILDYAKGVHLEAVKDLDQAKEVYLKGKNGYTLEDIKITEYITEYQTLKEVWKTALDKALGEKLYEVTIEAYNLKTKGYETGKAKVYDDGNKVRFAYMVKEFPTIVLPEGVYDTQLRGIYE